MTCRTVAPFKRISALPASPCPQTPAAHRGACPSPLLSRPAGPLTPRPALVVCSAGPGAAALLARLCSLYELTAALLALRRLQDSVVLQLAKLGLTTLTCDNLPLLHLKAIALLAAVRRPPSAAGLQACCGPPAAGPASSTRMLVR